MLPSRDADLAALKEMSIEELAKVRVDTVTGASRHEQRLSDAPASVSILTADDIKLYGWRTLGEALASVKGLLVTYDRGYGYLGVRGFNRAGDYSGRVLITVDGHRINDAMYDSSAMDRDFILDLDLVERIEVIKGPGSVLYGNNAFFGIINVITRGGRDVHGVEASGSYGTFDSYTGRLTYGTLLTNGVELMVSGSVYGSEGNPRLHYPEFSQFNNGNAEHMDQGSSRSAFASLRWTEFTFEGGYVDRYKRVPTAEYTYPDSEIVFNDRRFRTFDERAFASLRFDHTFAEEWNLMVRMYYDHYRYDGTYPYNYSPADPLYPTTINKDLDRTESIGTEFQLSKTFWDKHFITVGSEVRYDYDIKLENWDVDPPQIYLQTRQSGFLAGVFLQDEYRLLDNLTLTAGARYDYYKLGGDTVNPRAALVYHPWKPSTVKVLYGEAYRAPNANENYYDWPTPPSSTGLRPETVRSCEVVYEHRFDSVWSGSVAGFYSELEDLITYAPDGFGNLESARTSGVESEVQARWESGLSTRVNYTISEAVDSSMDERLPNSPEHLAKFQVSVPVWREKLFASAELQMMSKRRLQSGGSVDGNWVVNTTLFSRNLCKGLELSASIYNVFDQKFSDPASSEFLQSAIERDGRTVRIKVTWAF